MVHAPVVDCAVPSWAFITRLLQLVHPMQMPSFLMHILGSITTSQQRYDDERQVGKLFRWFNHDASACLYNQNVRPACKEAHCLTNLYAHYLFFF